MISKSHLLTGACLAALALTASAAPKKDSSPSPSASPATSAAAASPSAKAPRALPFRGTVASVDQNAKTFTLAGKESSRVFTVSDKTVITKAGAAAAMTDIAANDAVRGSYWKQADGTLEAKRVKIGEMPAAEKGAKKSRKAASTDASASPEASPSPSASPKK